MDREDQQNSSGTQTVPGQSQATAQWLSRLDPVSNQIMESLMTSNVGTQAFSSSFALFDFIFNSFATFADELNKNSPDESLTVKIERPSAPSERPNPQNAFEMIRIMKGHISVGMWALILYAKDGYLSVHLLPSQFLSSIVEDKMGDFPAYLEIVQPEGQTGSWQIENKPIVIEVIPGLIRHLVEHLVRVSRGEATANERFSFFSPRKTKETPSLAPVPVSEPAPAPVLTPAPPPSAVPAPAPLPFTMPASVQAAIAGNVLPSANPAPAGPGATPTSNGGDAPQAQSSPNNQAITRSQIIKNLMQEAREKEKNANQIFYERPNPQTIEQEKTVAVQQFAMPGAPDLGFQNPSTSNPGTSSSTSNPALPPFPAPPAGLFGSPPQGFSAPPGAPSMPTQLEQSNSQTPALANQPQAFQAPPPSPFARPSAPSGSAPPAPPPPPGMPPRPGQAPPNAVSGAPPAPPGPGFGSPPPFPGAAPAAPPPVPGLASISPPPMPTHFAPPPPPAPSAPAVPVVPFPQFTQTAMPAAQLPESLLEEVSQSSSAQAPASKSLFDDEDDSQEQEIVEPSIEEQSYDEQDQEAFALDGGAESGVQFETEESLELEPAADSEYQAETPAESESYLQETVNSDVQYDDSQYDVSYQEQETENYQSEDTFNEYDQEEVAYDQYETDPSYQMNGQITNGFAASIAEPLDTPEALGQIMYQSERVMREGCNHILNELDQVLDSLRAAAQVAMHNDNIQAVTDIMHHSKQIKALRERLVVFKDENVKEE